MPAGSRYRSSSAPGADVAAPGVTDTFAKASKKMSSLPGSLPVPFWSPPSPLMPKPKKRHPKSDWRFYKIPSESLVPCAPRSCSTGAQERDSADTGGERQCYQPRRTTEKAPALDDNLFDLRFDLGAEGVDKRSGATPSGRVRSGAAPSGRATLLDEGLLDLGFDLEAEGSTQEGSSRRSTKASKQKGMQDSAAASQRASVFDSSAFDLSFPCEVETIMQRQKATASRKVSLYDLGFAHDA